MVVEHEPGGDRVAEAVGPGRNEARIDGSASVTDQVRPSICLAGEDDLLGTHRASGDKRAERLGDGVERDRRLLAEIERPPSRLLAFPRPGCLERPLDPHGIDPVEAQGERIGRGDRKGRVGLEWIEAGARKLGRWPHQVARPRAQGLARPLELPPERCVPIPQPLDVHPAVAGSDGIVPGERAQCLLESSRLLIVPGAAGGDAAAYQRRGERDRHDPEAVPVQHMRGSCVPARRLLHERRGWDSNPRRTERPLTVFETAPFNHSGTPPGRLKASGGSGLGLRELALEHVAEDPDHLLGRLRGRHRRPVDLLQGVRGVGVVQGDDRLARARPRSRRRRRRSTACTCRRTGRRPRRPGGSASGCGSR